MVKLRYGHAPGHVRETFIAAVQAYMTWQAGEDEPKVVFEVKYEDTMIPISQACDMLWNCTDIVPRETLDTLVGDAGLPIGRGTYAACARAMKTAINYESAL